MNKYYLAYGSNLSMAQMAQRCPDAVYVGTAELKDYQLLFKGSQSGSYLTVEPKKGSMVPVLVWRISERDEHYLDRYEGYPSFYYKKTMEVEVQSFIGEKTDDVTEAIIYIMHEDIIMIFALRGTADLDLNRRFLNRLFTTALEKESNSIY